MFSTMILCRNLIPLELITASIELVSIANKNDTKQYVYIYIRISDNIWLNVLTFFHFYLSLPVMP